MGVYEEETCRWIESNLGEGGVFFDIGGNAGYFTLLGSKLVGDTGRVIVFEPVPLNIDVLTRQISLNDRRNVTLEPLAIADRVGTLSFDVEWRNANSHMSDVTITHAKSEPTDVLEVGCTTLDQWVADNDLRPDVLKIDVEGAEVHVLEGAKETLRTCKPRIVLSTHTAELLDTCLSMLRDANYHVVRLPGFEHELLGYPRAD